MNPVDKYKAAAKKLSEANKVLIRVLKQKSACYPNVPTVLERTVNNARTDQIIAVLDKRKALQAAYDWLVEDWYEKDEVEEK